jgi:hypothetical protein
MEHHRLEFIYRATQAYSLLFSFKYNKRTYLQRGEFLKNSYSIPRSILEKIKQRDRVTVPTHKPTTMDPKAAKYLLAYLVQLRN